MRPCRGGPLWRKITLNPILPVVRAHWNIENGVNWLVDAVFNEDRAQNRKDHGAENLAVIRQLALNVLKRARPEVSIRRKRKPSGWFDAFARSVLDQML